MKNLALSTLTILSILSCSNKLSESKVKNLVNQCLEKRPSYGTSIIETGKLSYVSKDKLEKLQILQNKGFLNVERKEKNNGWFKEEVYLVSLTEKAKPFVIETKRGYSANNSDNIVKLFTYKLNEVGTIQEIPAMNASEVSITLKKEDKTPFYEILETDKTDFKTKKIMIKKTENKGWVYCD